MTTNKDLNQRAAEDVLQIYMHDFGGFLGNIKYPLREAKAYQKELSEEALSEYIGDAFEALKDCINLSNELQNLYAGRDLTISEFPITAVLNRALFCLGITRDSESEIVRNIENNENIRGYNILYTVIILNLIKNCVKHAPKSKIYFSYDGNSFSVADDGPGIPDDLLESIFGEYSSKPDGGLGLQIVASNAERIGARVDVSNRPEGGALFTVAFNK